MSEFETTQDAEPAIRDDNGNIINGQAVEVEVLPVDEPYEVVPWTGEALVLSRLDDERLAVILDEIKTFRADQLAIFEGAVKQEVLDRMDGRTEWTIHLDGYDLSGDSPAVVAYNVDELRAVLARLLVDGLIPEKAIDDCIRPKKGFDVSKTGVNKLLKLGGPVKAAIEAIQHQPKRSVQVSRKGA